MANAYMLSFLVGQRFALGEGFSARFPGAWLVWEPGPWHAPSGEAWQTQTMHPTKQPDRPFAGDALCFELTGAESAEGFRVGRAKNNDIVLEDATVSREHFTLAQSGPGWALKPNLLRHVSVAGKEAGHAPVPLNDGAALSVGNVKLTFHDPRGFVSRLERESPVRHGA